MISFERALDIVLSSEVYLQSEKIKLSDSAKRVLAQDIKADIDQPPFSKSGMDGFACKRSDLGKKLKVTQSVLAGDTPKLKVVEGTCARIMTGAKIPEGADTVFMLEYSKEEEGYSEFVGAKTKDNIIKQGELVSKGDLVLEAGSVINARNVPLLAAFGAHQVDVYKKTTVGVISTGNELVEPSAVPTGSQIRNTNSYGICSHISELGADFKYYGIAKDNYEDTEGRFKKALSENDVVIFSGGASKGDLDYIGEVIERNCDLKFSEISLKPGRPTIYGTSQCKHVFGLPGNPVAVFAVFELLVKPLIYKLMGHSFKPAEIRMPLGEDVLNRNPDRDRLVPVKVREGELYSISYKGSSHSGCLIDAFGFITIPKGVGELKAGGIVDVRQI